MNLKLEAWACGNRLREQVEQDHIQWLANGAGDADEKERIDIMRDAVRLLKTCVAELNHREIRSKKSAD